MEFELLYFLAANPGQVFDRETLLREVWGYDYLGESDLVGKCVRRLREKIEINPSQPQIVVTVKGVGYNLADEANRPQYFPEFFLYETSKLYFYCILRSIFRSGSMTLLTLNLVNCQFKIKELIGNSALTFPQVNHVLPLSDTDIVMVVPSYELS